MTKANKVLRSGMVALERRGRKDKSAIWRDASRYLAAGRAERTEVNVGHLSKIGVEKGALFVPGKVLGSGTVEKALVVGAFSFSSSAKEKIVSAGGKAMSLEEFLKKYPEGSGVKLVR